METSSASSLQKTENDDGLDSKNTSKLFDAAFEMYQKLEKIQEATNSSKVQSDIRRTMNALENVTRMVSLLDVFSDNESFEDVSTENIKYFLLPALLGMLTAKVCGKENRLHIVDVTEIYFIDFLKRIKSYGLIDIEIPDKKSKEENEKTVDVPQKSEAQLITEMVNTRNAKIKRFNEQKELKNKLEILRNNLDNPNIDEEDKRDYFVTLVKMFANIVIDELSSLAMERNILEYAQKLDTDKLSSLTEGQKKVPKTTLKPYIITRDAIQKQVYGAGYPSLPVLTVEEFYEKKIRDGEWPDPSKRNQIGGNNLQDVASGKVDENLQEEKEEMDKEKLIETDDPENIARQRAMDEYKDTHRRGWGNRYNRS